MDKTIEKTGCNLVSGNFDTKEKEIEFVKSYLESFGMIDGKDFHNVRKYQEADAGDIEVTLSNNTKLLFEVKEEREARFTKFGEFGIDFLSAFEYRNESTKEIWCHPHQSVDLQSFLGDIKVRKWGKLQYSRSDIWLFVVQRKDGTYALLNGYDARKMKNANFATFLKHHAVFSANAKPESQMSSEDKYGSACFYVKPTFMNRFLITKDDFLHYMKGVQYCA